MFWNIFRETLAKMMQGRANSAISQPGMTKGLRKFSVGFIRANCELTQGQPSDDPRSTLDLLFPKARSTVKSTT